MVVTIMNLNVDLEMLDALLKTQNFCKIYETTNDKRIPDKVATSGFSVVAFINIAVDTITRPLKIPLTMYLNRLASISPENFKDIDDRKVLTGHRFQ
jgi:hypothetical protein